MGICTTQERRSVSRALHAPRRTRPTYHTPGALHAELDAERTSGECAEARWEDPEGDKRANEEDEDAMEDVRMVSFTRR